MIRVVTDMVIGVVMNMMMNMVIGVVMDDMVTLMAFDFVINAMKDMF